MDVFGAHWENHFERIRGDWLARVCPQDVVLLPGDLTWAMRLEDALEDIARVGELPGRKILVRGNHDYWWSAIGRVRRALPEGMYALQNDAILLEGVLYAGRAAGRCRARGRRPRTSTFTSASGCAWRCPSSARARSVRTRRWWR